MSIEDAPTQRIYSTSVGYVDFDRACAALNRIATGDQSPDQWRVLSALFAAALRHPRGVMTDRGVVDGLLAARVLQRMRVQLTPDDIDLLWSVLFVLFR